MSTAQQVTVAVDAPSVAAVEVIIGDLLGWHSGAIRVGELIEIAVPANDAGRVKYALRARGYWVA